MVEERSAVFAYVSTLPRTTPVLHAGTVVPAAIAILYPEVEPPPEAQEKVRLEGVFVEMAKLVGAGGSAYFVFPVVVTGLENALWELTPQSAIV